jgi:hypothetical protein
LEKEPKGGMSSTNKGLAMSSSVQVAKKIMEFFLPGLTNPFIDRGIGYILLPIIILQISSTNNIGKK